jgi:hypothetical protein
MSIFHHADQNRFRRTTEAGDRLSNGMSLLIIAGLSALCWAVLIAIVMAVQAAL